MHFLWECKFRSTTCEHHICAIFNSSLYDMAQNFRKRKVKWTKGLLNCRFMTMKTKHTNENKVYLQIGNVLASLSIYGCYSCLLESTNIGFIQKFFNNTYFRHCRNHCFNHNSNCIKLCVELTSWFLDDEWCTWKCN
jgi:hypothetical protein